VAATVVTLFFW